MARRRAGRRVHDGPGLALSLLRNAGVRRDEAVRELAERRHIAPDEVSLPALTTLAPPPFDHTFTEHLAAFGRLATEIESASRGIRVLARAELDHVTGSIGRMTSGEPTTSTTSGAHVRRGGGLDEELVALVTYRRALEGSTQVMTAVDQVLDRVDCVERGQCELASGSRTLPPSDDQSGARGPQATIRSLSQALPPSLVSFLR